VLRRDECPLVENDDASAIGKSKRDRGLPDDAGNGLECESRVAADQVIHAARVAHPMDLTRVAPARVTVRRRAGSEVSEREGRVRWADPLASCRHRAGGGSDSPKSALHLSAELCCTRKEALGLLASVFRAASARSPRSVSVETAWRAGRPIRRHCLRTPMFTVRPRRSLEISSSSREVSQSPGYTEGRTQGCLRDNLAETPERRDEEDWSVGNVERESLRTCLSPNACGRMRRRSHRGHLQEKHPR